MLKNREKNFEAVFRSHFQALHAYAYRMLHDFDLAEEVVQQVFLKLWEKDWERQIQTSLKAYLYRSVYNQSLNVLKRDRLKQRYQAHQEAYADVVQDTLGSDTELKRQLHLALQKLPEKSRTIFEMSRFQELRYQEIADALEISLKTVEGHMTKVLKHLRVYLVDYLTILVLLFHA